MSGLLVGCASNWGRPLFYQRRAGERTAPAGVRRRRPMTLFLYNDALAGIRGDTERLRQVEAALLGMRER